MTDEKAMEMAEETVKNNPGIIDWKAGFIGATAAHLMFGQLIEEKAEENYRLRMLLWFLHDCNAKEQYSGAQHSGIYMKCAEKGIDFASDSIEKIWDALHKPYPWKITQTAAGENPTHTAEEIR